MADRALLRESDELLDVVERWRAGLHRPPRCLQARLNLLARRCRYAPPPPQSAGALHDWLFDLQVSLGLEPDGQDEPKPAPAASPARADADRHRFKAVSRVFRPRRHSQSQEVIEARLPRPYNVDDPDWLALAEALVERNYYRWAYAYHQLRAKPERRRELAIEVDKAWRAYFDIHELLSALKAELAYEVAA